MHVLLLLLAFVFGESFYVAASEEELVFVILAHAKGDSALLWKRSYDSVRKFYPSTPVVIIDDHSPIPISSENLSNAVVLQSEYPGAGELLPYYYFLKYEWAEKMVFLHDSMFLKRAFEEKELSHPVKFHWHFSTHFWDKDCPIDRLLNGLYCSQELVRYNHNQHLWFGCFGVASVIDRNVLQAIENKYGFTEKLKSVVRSREHRMALERVFAILLFKEGYLKKEACSNFGDILHFPGSFLKNIGDKEVEGIVKVYPGAIIKTWHGR